MSSYALRLPESLKQAAKRIAAADDTTMNQFLWSPLLKRSVPWKQQNFLSNAPPLPRPKWRKRPGIRWATSLRSKMATGQNKRPRNPHEAYEARYLKHSAFSRLCG